MQILLDFQAHTPVYVQILEQIKFMIANGELKPGDQLLTVRQLATDLRVNFNTVARAYRLLDDEGLISTQHGRGTFVLARKAADHTEDSFRQQVMKDLTRRYLEQISQLGLSAEQIKTLFLQDWENFFLE